MSVFQELEEDLCCEEHIGEGAVAVEGTGNLKAFTEGIETVTRCCFKEALAEEHCAQAQREFDVSPAAFFLYLEEASVECGVVCDKGGIFCKGKEFWENGHDGRGIAQCVICDVVDPPGIRGNGTFGVHQ